MYLPNVTEEHILRIQGQFPKDFPRVRYFSYATYNWEVGPTHTHSVHLRTHALLIFILRKICITIHICVYLRTSMKALSLAPRAPIPQSPLHALASLCLLLPGPPLTRLPIFNTDGAAGERRGPLGLPVNPRQRQCQPLCHTRQPQPP